MNDYMKLIAHAAAKFTGRPAVLSPLLDSYCGWENKKNRFSSEPIKGDFRVILSAGGLSVDELKIDVGLTEKIPVNEKVKKSDGKFHEGRLIVSMQHGSKRLGENLKWSRDCTYEYMLNKGLSPLAHNLAAYWTTDDFLVIQARSLRSLENLTEEYSMDNILEFRLIPIEVIDVLEPALNVPFLKQILKGINKKSSDVSSYVNAATEVPEASDVLSLMKCIRLTEGKKDLQNLKMVDTEGSSQEDSEGQSPDKRSSKSDEAEQISAGRSTRSKRRGR